MHHLFVGPQPNCKPNIMKPSSPVDVFFFFFWPRSLRNELNKSLSAPDSCFGLGSWLDFSTANLIDVWCRYLNMIHVKSLIGSVD